MEQIENEVINTEDTNPEVETLEANATDQNDSEGASASDANASDGKVLSEAEYQEYRKLKRISEKSTKESSESSEETGSQEVTSPNKEVEELTFEVLGVNNEEAKDLARKMVRLGEASSLKEAVNSDLVKAKVEAAATQEAVESATPSSSRRTPTTNKDTVEYWVDREGLPENQALRFEVVKARRAKRNSQSMFGTPRKITIK